MRRLTITAILYPSILYRVHVHGIYNITPCLLSNQMFTFFSGVVHIRMIHGIYTHVVVKVSSKEEGVFIHNFILKMLAIPSNCHI
jgi:hypothetical protein